MIARHPHALACFLLLLIFFETGFLGSFIINVAGLNPPGWKSRTKAIFFLGIITFGIYPIVVTICQFTFDGNKATNIGYYRV
ncbi:MAG: hypothetical protein LBK70_02745 [Clostridiales bacterium]|nr:hypothetical protein [Clostridiales bacterium]